MLINVFESLSAIFEEISTKFDFTCKNQPLTDNSTYIDTNSKLCPRPPHPDPDNKKTHRHHIPVCSHCYSVPRFFCLISSSIAFVLSSSFFETFLIKRNVNIVNMKKIAIQIAAGIYSVLSSGKYKNKFNTNEESITSSFRLSTNSFTIIPR
ncbi:hypothetical protein GA0061094_3849 [[Bacillus] enclensis]|uniref:Uncharacterized protein n=1 Tax=[Bacillus] enclensis TaxID=1402860 RepID=A0A1C4DGX6_9BACI|nr:hypothetical protein GA0061094_3849 [[Bacillus] enclensis]